MYDVLYAVVLGLRAHLPQSHGLYPFAMCVEFRTSAVQGRTFIHAQYERDQPHADITLSNCLPFSKN